MPKFFLPFAASTEQAEQTYGQFVGISSTYELTHDTARLFRISFPSRPRVTTKKISTPCVAEVGKEITNWSEQSGEVLAIIETKRLISIHTRLRTLRRDGPILVSPDEVLERVYFDDFPARPSEDDINR